MMNFRVVKTAVDTILEAYSASKYIVTGGQRQSKGADENALLPRVTTYYQSGDFPLSSSNFQTDKTHNVEIKIEITVVVKGKVDLSVLNNDSSSQSEIAAALAAMPDIAKLADDKFDETFEDVYQAIMAADKYDLDLPIGTARNRWINNVKKDNPNPRGEYMILTGFCLFSCQVNEQVTGITGIDGDIIENSIEIKDDPNKNAGTSGTLGGE